MDHHRIKLRHLIKQELETDPELTEENRRILIEILQELDADDRHRNLQREQRRQRILINSINTQENLEFTIQERIQTHDKATEQALNKVHQERDDKLKAHNTMIQKRIGKCLAHKIDQQQKAFARLCTAEELQEQRRQQMEQRRKQQQEDFHQKIVQREQKRDDIMTQAQILKLEREMEMDRKMQEQEHQMRMAARRRRLQQLEQQKQRDTHRAVTNDRGVDILNKRIQTIEERHERKLKALEEFKKEKNENFQKLLQAHHSKETNMNSRIEQLFAQVTAKKLAFADEVRERLKESHQRKMSADRERSRRCREQEEARRVRYDKAMELEQQRLENIALAAQMKNKSRAERFFRSLGMGQTIGVGPRQISNIDDGHGYPTSPTAFTATGGTYPQSGAKSSDAGGGAINTRRVLQYENSTVNQTTSPGGRSVATSGGAADSVASPSNRQRPDNTFITNMDTSK